MKLNFLSAVLVLGMGSSAFAQSGAEAFVSNYAKLPKSYDAKTFEGDGCSLSITGGYIVDGTKYLQLAGQSGETVFLSFDAKKTYTGNVLSFSQAQEEPNGYDEGSLWVTHKLKLVVDDNGKPVRAVGVIDRPFPYSNSKFVCEGFKP